MEKRSGRTLLGGYRGRRGYVRAEQTLAKAVAEGRENPDRARERLGEASVVRPDGPVIWFHVATEREGTDLPNLIERLTFERDDLTFLVTTAEYEPEPELEKRLPENSVHQYLPYEFGAGIVDFLDHWKPDAVVWADPVLRIPILDAAMRREAPVFLINAMMPDDQVQKMRWLPGAGRGMLSRFSQLLAVDGRSAGNLRRLGVPAERIEVTGYLQEGTPPLPCVQSERDTLAELLGARPVWLAAGIDKAEEDAVISAHRRVSRRSHRLLLILVPKDETRGESLATELEKDGWIAALRSTEEEPEPDIQIFVADLPDELGLWYRLSPIAFMGQSLADGPGRDPYEATALGSAVLHGPNVGAFRQSYDRLQAAGAARQVRNSDELTAELEYLLAPDKAAEMARAAWEVSTSGAAVTDRIGTLIFDTLDARRL